MNIIDATKQALAEKRAIQRTSYGGFISIIPTNTCYELVTAMADEEKTERHPYWNPRTDDVLADDWTVEKNL